ncbi:right-handed parallel beta-helix repeat-containing protein [Terriglobus albidus]|uniref:hypothetical protein n=1 Tax=Terriglobus albidus TaxID=1592106 RepID=UPI0021E067BE|nr:hypothetical protein [Terriglobus albidus]
MSILSSASAIAQASRTWVSGVGDDANPCSRTAPCKTFAGAISKTAPNGEIDALDPGGFGPVTITKSITIDGGPNAGGIAGAGTNGIVISAASTDVVTIRNLYIECQGTTPCNQGVQIYSGKVVHLNHVDIGGFTNGVNQASASTTNPTTLFVDYSMIHDCTAAGINVSPAVVSNASIAHTMLQNNQNGINVSDYAKVAANDVIADGNSNAGFKVTANTASASLNLFNSSAVSNTVAGIQVTGTGSVTATARISGVSTASNGVAISTSGPSAVLSFQNNPIIGAGLPTGNIALQ